MVCNALRKQSIIDIMEVIKMKKSDLHREWARVLDMCEGTKVDPSECWKFDGEVKNRCISFDSCGKYEFAVAVLEDKPVFVGDKIYSKLCSAMITVDCPISNSGYYSWNPPKKTFMLNGEHLPCPENISVMYELRIQGLEENIHNFVRSRDIRRVEDAINKLLLDNTK